MNNTISIRTEENSVVSPSIVCQEEVSICESNILATVTEDNRCYFSPRHVCEALGITWQAQLVKIKADPVLSQGVAEIATPSSGGFQKTTMLPLEFLSGWLFTIKKVRPELQAKLNLFRAEAFLALDAWFRQGLRSNPVVQEQFEIPQSLSEALEFAAQQVRENMRLKKQNALMGPKVALFDAYMNTEGTLTLTEAGKILGLSAKVLGRELRQYGWLFKRKKGVIPTQHAMKRGWMIAVPIDGSIEGMPNCYGRITKRGLEILMETYLIEEE
jgi:phage antirepressor YoqD-like protein